MYSRGIRGAITLDKNDKESIKSATIEIIDSIISSNNINTEDISFAIFTVTDEIDAAFPAKYARECSGFEQVPMMCYREMSVKDSIKMCLRVLITVNTDKKQDEIKHQYLKGASILRPDLK